MKTIAVCIGSACHLKGSYPVLKGIEAMVAEKNLADKITLKAEFCMGHCSEAVSVRFMDVVHSVSPETVRRFFDEVVMPNI